MYEQGGDVWVLKSGGNWQGAITKTTDVINLSDPEPSWVWVSDVAMDMVVERRRHRLVLLPDGTILAVGGERIATTSAAAAVVPVKKAELFDPDPEVEAWAEMAEMSNPRARHGIGCCWPMGASSQLAGRGMSPKAR